MARTLALLPAQVRPPFDVFLNGVPQQPGRDFRVQAGALVFDRELRRDRVSKRRWLLGAWGVGTYRQDDVVDVRYTAADGAVRVAHGLELVAD